MMTTRKHAQALFSLALGVLFVPSAGCSRNASTPQTTQQSFVTPADAYRIPAADRPPAALLRLGRSAADLFDAAWSADWPQSAAHVQSLNEAIADLPGNLSRPALAAELQSRLVSVTDATSARRRIDTMDGANAIVQIVAELSAQYQPRVPYDVTVLGYYGRRIELGIAAGRLADSRQAASDLLTVWQRIQPAIEGGGHTDEARRFNDIMVALMNAKQASDFTAPVTAELAAAERLERLFNS